VTGCYIGSGIAPNLFILLGDGQGDLGPAQWMGTLPEEMLGPFGVAVADVVGDSRPDLVTADSAFGRLSLLRNDSMPGTPSFVVSATLIMPQPPGAPFPEPRSVALGTFPGAEGLFIAVADRENDSVAVFLRNPSGGYNEAVSYPVGDRPVSVAAADLNGDFADDLVVANNLGKTLSILINDGFGGFHPRQDIGAGDGPKAVTVADIDGLGGPDLVHAGSGVGGPPYYARVTLSPCGPPSFPSDCCKGDVNQDGRVDEDDIEPFQTILAGGYGTPYQLCAADFDDNGVIDGEDEAYFLKILQNNPSCNGGGGFAPQGFGGPDGFAGPGRQAADAGPDCNENGVPDDVETAAGNDCDANGVPDECDVAFGRGVADADGDLRPDACAQGGARGETADAPDTPDGFDPAAAWGAFAAWVRETDFNALTRWEAAYAARRKLAELGLPGW